MCYSMFEAVCLQLVPDYQLDHSSHFHQVTDWPIVVWGLSVTFLVVRAYQVELPSRAEVALSDREGHHMDQCWQCHF